MSSVWYIGTASKKTIVAATWFKAIGSGSYSDTTWDSTNAWSLPTSSFTTAQLNLLAQDSEFSLNQADGPRIGAAPTSSQLKNSDPVYYAAAANLLSQLSLSASEKLVNVGNFGYGSTLVANVASTVGTGEMMFTIGAPCTGVAAVWNHWYTVPFPTFDTDPAGPITISASIRVVSSTNPGTTINQLYRLTFNGKITVTIDPGGKVQCDLLGLSLAKGDIVAIRTYLSAGTAYAPRSTYGIFSTTIGGFIAATDATAPGSAAITNSQGNYYGPSVLLGEVTNDGSAKSVLLLGDSRAYGAGDNGIAFTTPQLAPGGFFIRALSGKAGLLNLASNGDLASYFQATSGSFRRLSNVSRCTSAIIEYGVNDLFVSPFLTALQIETINLDIANKIRRLGITKVFLTTILPYTTTTDGWATVGGQTVFSSSHEIQRVAYNTWIRANCPIDPVTLLPVAVGTPNALLAGSFGHPITGFFDLASKVESSLNSGFWLPAKRIVTGSMTSGSTTLTSSTANFNSANQEVGGDHGGTFSLAGAGAAGAYLTGWNIAAVGSTTSITTTAPGGASTTVTNAQLNMGLSTVDGLHPSSEGHVLITSAIDVTKL